MLAIVADNEDQRVPIGARASLMLLAAQLQALQTLIGLIKNRIMAQHRFTLTNMMARVAWALLATRRRFELVSHSAVLPYQAASVCYYDFEQPVYWGPT